jgi:hypothetical protein
MTEEERESFIDDVVHSASSPTIQWGDQWGESGGIALK